MFLLNSRLGRFAATHISSSREGLHLRWAVLLPKLRTEIAEFLSMVLLTRREDTLLTHLCRFAVRMVGALATGLFLAAGLSIALRGRSPLVIGSRRLEWKDGFACPSRLRL